MCFPHPTPPTLSGPLRLPYILFFCLFYALDPCMFFMDLLEIKIKETQLKGK